MSRSGNTLVLGALLTCGGALAGERYDAALPVSRTVTVRVYPFANVPAKALERAKDIAAHIFAQAQVRLLWVACPTSAEELDEEKYAGCRRPVDRRDLFLRINPSAPVPFAKRQGVSGVALLEENDGPGGTALVFYDRVERMTWERLLGATQGVFAYQLPPDFCTSMTLGIVIAHELGHLLLGTNSHSIHGVMQAKWNRRDLEDCFRGLLRFTPEQVQQMHLTLDAWGTVPVGLLSPPARGGRSALLP